MADSLITKINNVVVAMSTAVKQDRTFINGNTSSLESLATTNKTNLVAAINEVASSAASATGIDDGTTAGTSTWSSQKINTEISDTRTAVEAEIPVLTSLIDDTTPSTTTVYSSSHTDSAISTAVGGIDLTDLIDDVTPSATTTYSSSKVDSQIAATKDEILGGADAAYDTLLELQQAIQGDESVVSGLTTQVGNKVDFSAAQSLTDTQKAQARTNIDAAATADITALRTDLGDVASADFVATFNAGLAA